MSAQLALSLPARRIEPESERRFREFCAANPHIVDEIERLAIEHKRRGWLVSINGIFEIVRYQARSIRADDTYRLNNNFRAPMARLLMQRCPELRGFFATRLADADRFDTGA